MLRRVPPRHLGHPGRGGVLIAAGAPLDAEKTVGSEAVPKYSIELAYDAKRDAWASEFQGPNAHGAWSYVVHGDEMLGTLVDLPSRHLVRHVYVRRD